MLVGPEKSGKSLIFDSLCEGWEMNEVDSNRSFKSDGLATKSFSFDIEDPKNFRFPLSASFRSRRKTRTDELSHTNSDRSVNRNSERAIATRPVAKPLGQPMTSTLSTLPSALKASITLWDFSGRDSFVLIPFPFFP